MSTDPPPPTNRSTPDEPAVIVYVVPFVGVLLLAGGIGAGVLGGYSAIQANLGLCGDPTILVESAAGSGAFAGPDAPAVPRFDASDLSPAERSAVRRAAADPRMEAEVRGPAPHLDAFRAGALVSLDGETRYVTLASAGACVGADPLLFPIGVGAILLGIVGVLTPPIYRRAVVFEERTGR